MLNTNKKTLIVLFILLLLLPFVSGLSAEETGTGDTTEPGTEDIQPEDTLTFPENTVWGTLTASWGVEVQFLDYDGTLLKSEILEVTDTTDASTTAPADPGREGYRFDKWEADPNNKGKASVEGKDVSSINGPGPVKIIAQYKKLVTVKFTLKGDVDLPEEITAPDELTVPEGDTVDLEDLSISCSYAYINGKKVSGKWRFVSWSENHFAADQDVTVTANLQFVPSTVPNTSVR